MSIEGNTTMKNFSNQTLESLSGCPKSLNRPMPPPLSHGSFENIRLAGRKVGASMIMEGGGDSSGESPGSCSIKIYINNDIQGINNSVLIGSDVRLGDPGVRLCLEELKMDRGVRLLSKAKDTDSLTYSLLLVALVMLFISVFAYFIA